MQPCEYQENPYITMEEKYFSFSAETEVASMAWDSCLHLC